MGSKYPSDANRQQFEPILESARKTTYPRRVGLHEAFCGALCICCAQAANGER